MIVQQHKNAGRHCLGKHLFHAARENAEINLSLEQLVHVFFRCWSAAPKPEEGASQERNLEQHWGLFFSKDTPARKKRK